MYAGEGNVGGGMPGAWHGEAGHRARMASNVCRAGITAGQPRHPIGAAQGPASRCVATMSTTRPWPGHTRAVPGDRPRFAHSACRCGDSCQPAEVRCRRGARARRACAVLASTATASAVSGSPPVGPVRTTYVIDTITRQASLGPSCRYLSLKFQTIRSCSPVRQPGCNYGATQARTRMCVHVLESRQACCARHDRRDCLPLPLATARWHSFISLEFAIGGADGDAPV
jgi:hypothetical protein